MDDCDLVRPGELVRTRAGRWLLRAYRFRRLRRLAVRLILRSERGVFWSGTIRDLLRTYHGVEVGAYSYGDCLLPGVFPAGVTVGRYVSIAAGVRVFVRNHPMERLSMHPLFYNRALGMVKEDTISHGTLFVGHDAWLGERAIITPGCHRIGIGAVVGAGAVVTKDVPDFAVVGGNPAKVIKYRFSESTQRVILQSRWWERTAGECLAQLEWMVRDVESSPLQHPLLVESAVCHERRITPENPDHP